MLFFYFFYFFNMSMALYNHTACNDYITLHDTASTDVKEKQCGLYRQRFRKLVKMGDSEGVSLQVVGDIRPSEEFKGVKDNIYEIYCQFYKNVWLFHDKPRYTKSYIITMSTIMQ